MPHPTSSPSRPAACGVSGFRDRLIAACKGPNALKAFFGVSFLESSLLPVPIDLAMVPLGLAQPKRLWLIALIGAFGSLAGALLGYALGALAFDFAGEWMIDAWGMTESFSRFQIEFDEKGWLAVVLAALTPIPFKFAAILAGTVSMRLDIFIAAAFGARLVRFGLMALVIRIFGAGLQVMMTHHSRKFTALAVAATILGVLMTPFFM